MKHALAGLFVLLLLEGAGAEVIDSASSGFTIASEVMIDTRRGTAWRRATKDIDKWWSPDHTVSGDASRLSISAKPQGCFCEDLGGDGGVVHMTVTMVYPQVVLRLTGGLGPLGLMGVEGNMTWEFDDVEDQTRVKFTYAVGGYREKGLDGMADAVDSVISEQLSRLKAYIETGNPELQP